ncbi:MAG: DUF4450 domain-containing protein [Verrucomicrobia bacterium]|nr:DUF4450 domain-containing protein [Verrucomicrobiota bacterium]
MNTSRAANRYEPIAGGWRIRITGDPPSAPTATVARLGEPDGDPRLHRRPLYPPADKSLLWSAELRGKIERSPFRPIVLAYNAPRFLLDLFSAGGLAGHCFIGLAVEGGKDKWFHQWSDLEVKYVDGRMEYALSDPDFPGATVSLAAASLADSIGLIVKYAVRGLTAPSCLVWSYGGASAFVTNYDFKAREFSFSPEQCAKDRIRIEHGTFSLRRAFDQSDDFVKQKMLFSVAETLPDWRITIRGGGPKQGTLGIGDPNQMLESPAKLLVATEWDFPEKSNGVVVQKIPFGPGEGAGTIAFGIGGSIEQVLRTPEAAWTAALKRNRTIADRMVINTPDPHLDAAITMLAFATEGTWGDVSIVHGGWSWRIPHPGWRIWYGPTCYGWTDRIRASIRNHVRFGLRRDGPDKGAIGSLFDLEIFGDGFGFMYNMNEVFIDQVRHYLEYTNDRELMREIFPVIQGIVDWENRRLQPEHEYLYESSLDVDPSDSHWYIGGQCTIASAYMLRAYRLLAELAGYLGDNPAPFRERARLIRAAMQRRLWMPRAGVFAEFRDTRGHWLLHPSPSLPAIYHAAEFGAADELQIYQMLHWVDQHLEHIQPVDGGKLVWNVNWLPVHSVWEPFYHENLNYAETNYLAGRADEAYAFLRGVCQGMYRGPTPGGLPSGPAQVNDEYADGNSMGGRAVFEGLFGIRVNKPQGRIDLTPQFPSDWPQASIQSPYLSYDWKKADNCITLKWKTPEPTRVRVRLPLRAAEIKSVAYDGRPVAYAVEAGVRLTWLVVCLPEGKGGNLEAAFTPTSFPAPADLVVKQGDPLSVDLARFSATDFLNPQKILDQVRVEEGVLKAVVTGEPGPALLFLAAGSRTCPVWLPLRLRIDPKAPVPAKVWRTPQVPRNDPRPWHLIDLSAAYNARFTDVIDRVDAAADAQEPKPPASPIGFRHWKIHLTQYWSLLKSERPTDEAWRKKVGPDQIGWTTDGIPFKSAKEGPNIAVVTRAGGFPAAIGFPVNARGRALYLMLSGVTWQMQSHVVNLAVTLQYADGQRERVNLLNPFDLSDCWVRYFRYLDADGKRSWCFPNHKYHPRKPAPAYGFENIGGRYGPAGSDEAPDRTKWFAVDTEAHLVSMELRPDAELASVGLEAIANDLVFGVMGASVLT